MYELETYDNIMERCLKRVPQNVDKREGSIVYDALAPVCLELSQLYTVADFLLNQTSILTANREGLANWGKIFEITPKQATYTTARAVFNVDVPIGSRFNSDKLNFKVIKKLDGEYEYELECENVGAIGNNCIGRINPIDNINGLTMAKITDIIAPGEGEEDTEVYRERFIKEIKSDAYGGNLDDYKIKVNAIKGVGDCKVFRCPRGGGTVDVAIINSNFEKPNEELVKEVQNVLHPIDDSCGGLGVAPIGHDVLVKGVEAFNVDVSFNLYTTPQTNFEELKMVIIKAINRYFKIEAERWAKLDNITLRGAYIIAEVLPINGVTDITNVRFNGVDDVLELTNMQIPVVGEVTNA